MFIWAAILGLLWGSLLTNEVYAIENSRAIGAVPSDYEGPVFIDVYGTDVDTTPITEPTTFNITLPLHVKVWDPDGVDTVIGSYRNYTEADWNNVTMAYIGDDPDNASIHWFIANVTTWFLADALHTRAIWNMKYYAGNIHDRWAVSNVVNYTVHTAYTPTSPTYPPDDSTLLMVGGIAAMVTASVIVAIYLKRRGR